MSSPFDTEERVNVHFVDESGKSNEDSSDDMKMAFQVCSEHNMSPKWITNEACMKCNPSKTDVFVFQEFKGEAFEFLKLFAGDCIIIGPRCILDCMRAGTLIPKGNIPLLTIAMRNLVITTTGFPDDLKASIIEKVQYMGGIYCGEYRQSVTHLVAYKLLSDKYELARENGIPVMTEEWASAVWEESQRRNVHATDEEFMVYKCPIFYKMVITCSQLPRKLKEEIRSLINSNGGEFSGQLQSSKTTLLIVMRGDGEKYQYAKSWKLPCIKPSWVKDSVKMGYALPVEKYMLEGSGPVVKASTPEANAVPMPDASISCIQGVASRIGESLLDNTTVSTISSKVPVSPRMGQYMKLIDELNLSLVKRAGAFLDGCNVYLSGFSPEYTEKLRRILNSGGAIRFNEISEAVTHVIVGDFVPADITEIKSSESRLHVVTVAWLIESIKLRSVAPEGKFSCSDALPSPIEQQSPLSKKGLLVLHNSQNSNKHVRCLEMNSPQKRKENLEPRNLLQQYLQASTSAEGKSDMKSNSQDKTGKDDDDITVLGEPNQFVQENTSRDSRPTVSTEDSRPRESSEVSKPKVSSGISREESDFPSETSCASTALTQSDIFAGLTFALGGLSAENLLSLEKIIQCCGGQVVRKSFSGIPDYGVVPLEGAKLKHTTTEVVTILWVDDCYEEKQLLPVQYYHMPLTLDSDSLPLAGCVMSISSYMGAERRFLSTLIERLGGLNQAMFARIDQPSQGSRASTHLICPDNTDTKSSRKFKAALKWGVPPVSHRWLLACAKEGKKVDEGPYCVIPDAEGSSTPETSAGGRKRKFEDETNNFATPKPYNSPLLAQAGSVGTPAFSTPRPHGDMTSFATPKPYNSSLLAQAGPLGTSTFSTPKPPGHIDTPETPYGQVFKDNPSPNTRKKWKKWINQFPEFPQDKCPSPKQRRLSTPISELRRQCWEKFGAGYYEVESVEKENEESEIEETAEPETRKEVVEERTEGSGKHREDMPSERVSKGAIAGENCESQNSMTGGDGVGINTQLLELDKILTSASKKITKEVSSVNAEQNAEPGPPPKPPPAPESLDICGDVVEWVDPAVKNHERKVSETNRTLLFMLTSLDNREYYEGVIRSLGGVVSTKQEYEKGSTHLVCLQPSRSEKLLSCIAAGKWVLDKTYLDDSKKAGYFLEEEPYEWGNPKASSLMSRVKVGSLNHQLALAVYRWRCKIKQTGAGAFAGMKVIVCSSPDKTALYSRLIEAGGGEILDIRPPYSEPGNATLCIIEFSKVNFRVDLESLARHNVPCVPAMFLNNYLIHDPCPDPRSCLLPEYEAVLTKVQQPS